MSDDPRDAARLVWSENHIEWMTAKLREMQTALGKQQDEIARLTQERDDLLKRVRFYNVDGARLERERDEARRSAEALRVALLDIASLEVTGGAACNRAAEALGWPVPPKTTQPTTADVERARELLELWEHSTGRHEALVQTTAAALTAARREERELRALDEAVVEAAQIVAAALPISRGWSYAPEIDRLRRALAARDAAIRARGGEE